MLSSRVLSKPPPTNYPPPLSSWAGSHSTSLTDLTPSSLLAHYRILQISFSIMRYEDWDVLLFPDLRVFPSDRDARPPLKEFKVNCHVVPDAEFSHSRRGFGLPAMTCFVPSLPPGRHFHISVHCWSTPQISQHALNYSKHPELVKFEARILIDGRLVA